MKRTAVSPQAVRFVSFAFEGDPLLPAGASTKRGCQVVAAHGHHCQVPRPLDGRRQASLMLGAYAGLAPGLDLGLVRQVPRQHVDVFVVNILGVVHAEGAYLPSRIVTRSAAAKSAATTAARGPSPWAASSRSR